MIDGIKIQIYDKEYIVPALTLKQVKKLQSDINDVGSLSRNDGMLTEEKIDKMINIIFEAFCRNYPDITRDELSDMIDLGNVKNIFLAVLGVSGIIEKKTENQAISP